MLSEVEPGNSLRSSILNLELPLPIPPPTDPGWTVVEEGFNLAREHEIESLFAIANGYIGTRAALAERSWLSSPATFVAGVFQLTDSQPVPELVVLPDWTHLHARVDDEPLSLHSGKILEHRRILDLRRGLLWRVWRHQDRQGRVTRVLGFRFASLANPHVLFQWVGFAPENYDAQVRLESRVELSRLPSAVGSPTSAKVAASVHPPLSLASLSLRALGTNVTVSFATASEVRVEKNDQREEAEAQMERQVNANEEGIVERFDLKAENGKSYRLERLVTVYTSRDTPQPDLEAARSLQQLVSARRDLLSAHVSAWEERWRSAEIDVEGDEVAQRALRLAAYHLISAANPHDEHVSVPARALTGSAYKGHVFWDTEIYMVPFYIFSHPPSARSLLMYRYNTLPAARAKARALNYEGALYAWESADTGAETTPMWAVGPDGEVVQIRNGELEQHISADVAYAVSQYWQATGDIKFLLDAGAEIILETARFWASRAEIENDGNYHIRHVIGPDEYHEDVDDDAYTNLMAQWNLECAVEIARTIQKCWPGRWRELAAAIGIVENEIERWLSLAERIYTGFHPETGVHEQFRGYFDLEHIDLGALEPRTTAIDVLLGRERVRWTDAIKQADVIMAVYLLWHRFADQVRVANFRYYEPKTAHGSSLSPSVHALIAARLGDVVLAERYFKQAADIDIANNMGNAAGGVHAAALGGLWQAAVFGIAGVRTRPDGLCLQPNLLPTWKSIRFPFIWRGRTLRFDVQQSAIEIELEGEGPVPLSVIEGTDVVLTGGKRYRVHRDKNRWKSWEEVRA